MSQTSTIVQSISSPQKSASAQSFASRQQITGMNSDVGAAQHVLESESDFQLRLRGAVGAVLDCAGVNAASRRNRGH